MEIIESVWQWQAMSYAKTWKKFPSTQQRAVKCYLSLHICCNKDLTTSSNIQQFSADWGSTGRNNPRRILGHSSQLWKRLIEWKISVCCFKCQFTLLTKAVYRRYTTTSSSLIRLIFQSVRVWKNNNAAPGCRNFEWQKIRGLQLL